MPAPPWLDTCAARHPVWVLVAMFLCAAALVYGAYLLLA
jgi:hypothetical protein